MWRRSKTGRIEDLVVFKFRGDRYVPAGLLTFEGGGRKRVGRFVYAQSYLGPGTKAIDPIGMPVRRGSRAAQPEEVQLAFHDSGPDGWGKGILDLAFPDLMLSMPEYLALGGTSRTGDLAYGPSPSGPETWSPDSPPLIGLPSDEDDLEDLLQAIEAVDRGDRSTRSHLTLLLRTSSGVGGARPKARLRYQGRDWIAKFSAWGDRFDEPKVEAICLDASAAAGIETPRHELLTVAGRSILLVERFDRDGDGRPLGYLSAGTLLQEPSASHATSKTYTDIVDVGRRIGAPDPAKGMFKRLVLNSAIRNTDDHLRNHAFIDDGTGWRLSPVFDVVPYLGRARHVVSPAPGVSPEWSPSGTRAAYVKFGLNRHDAEEICAAVDGAIDRLSHFMEARELTRGDCDLVWGAIGKPSRRE